jgi:hypothetical protein
MPSGVPERKVRALRDRSPTRRLASNVGADLQIRPRADLKLAPYAFAVHGVSVQQG